MTIGAYTRTACAGPEEELMRRERPEEDRDVRVRPQQLRLNPRIVTPADVRPAAESVG